MSLEAINSINNVVFKGNIKTKNKQIDTSKEIKDSKSKLVLALCATAAISAAGIIIAKGKSYNKFANSLKYKTLQELNEINTSKLSKKKLELLEETKKLKLNPESVYVTPEIREEMNKNYFEACKAVENARNIFGNNCVSPTRKALFEGASTEGAKLEINGREYISKKLNNGKTILISNKDKMSVLLDLDGFITTIKVGNDKIYTKPDDGILAIAKNYSSKNGQRHATELIETFTRPDYLYRDCDLQNWGRGIQAKNFTKIYKPEYLNSEIH